MYEFPEKSMYFLLNKCFLLQLRKYLTDKAFFSIEEYMNA
jgi:hypothetical protein